MTPQILSFVSLLLAAVPVAARPLAPRADFGLEDLRALIAELEPHVPKSPLLEYPIDVTIVDGPDINAFATARPEEGLERPRAVMVFYTGIIEAAQGDRTLLRGVLAHELAHLSRAHMFIATDTPGDLLHYQTRQKEYEADALGAEFLVAAGHPREDMVAALMFLDRVAIEKDTQWLRHVASDHASPVMRAALLRRDETAYKAVARFEMGTAFLQCRRYRRALELFDEAIALEPRLMEARVNAVVAALEDYYDRLPESVQEAWLQPAFDVHLTETRLLRGRSIEVTPEDLKRYDEVMKRITEVPLGVSPSVMSFLRGTAAVLDPRGNETFIRFGADTLAMALTVEGNGAIVGPLRLRYANNRALGLVRLGDEAGAAKALLDEQLSCTFYVHEAAANLARLPLGGLTQDRAKYLLTVLAHHLRNSPPMALSVKRSREAFETVQKTYKLRFTGKIEPAPVYYCQVTSASIGGHEVALFDPLEDVTAFLGTKLGEGMLDERYPDLVWTLHGELDVILFGERDEVVKITTYRDGDTVTLVPRRASGVETNQTLRVGMTEEELDAVLATAGGEKLAVQTLSLVGRWCFQQTAPGEAPVMETWTYYPALNVGVFLVDGRVAGLSVTPVKTE
jgi:tetratricopeptide (TPR) repeat protein